MQDFYYIVLAIAINVLIWMIFYRPCGTMKIDHSDPEKDLYQLVVDNLDSLSKKKFMVIRVDNKADLRNENNDYNERP